MLEHPTKQLRWRKEKNLRTHIRSIVLSCISKCEVQSDLRSTTGYIQTPGWRHFTEEAAYILNDMEDLDSWVNVSIPTGHQAMVTVLDNRLDQGGQYWNSLCPFTRLELWVRFIKWCAVMSVANCIFTIIIIIIILFLIGLAVVVCVFVVIAGLVACCWYCGGGSGLGDCC